MANFKKYTKKNGQEAWQFSAYLGTDPKTGKRLKTTRRGFDTKKQAQRACNQLLAEFDADSWASMQEHSNTEPATFKDVAELWLTSYKLTVQSMTYGYTVSKLNNHIYPSFGDKPIETITRIDCQKAVNEWYTTYKTIGTLTNVASRIFKYAVLMEVLDKNPMEAVIKPVDKSTMAKRIKVYSKQDVAGLLNYLKTNQTSYRDHLNYALIRLLFYTGLRIGEAVALEWADIDFEHKTITVNKTYKRVKGGYTIGVAKTAASIADLPIDTQTLAILKQWRAYQREQRFAQGFTNDAPVFCEIDGRYTCSNAYYYRFKCICAAAGVAFKGIHVTRHTHASMLIEAGANLKEVQKRLRHASIRMTLDVYGHLSREYELSTLDKFVQYLDGTQNGSQ